jgi:hypothetical protein
LSGSALQALAKSFSEFQDNTFVVRIAELRLGAADSAGVSTAGSALFQAVLSEENKPLSVRYRQVKDRILEGKVRP